MSLQLIICLILLDLSAAFGTIDHSILFERLSAWFGITSVALSWMKSYLLNRSLYVNVGNTKSSLFQLLDLWCKLVLLKGLFSDLFSSSYTPFLSVLSYLFRLQIIIRMQMILNFSYNSLLLTLHMHRR
jgi:hypothetical protein